MKSILEQETALYEEVHSLDNYSNMSPGEKYLPIFLENAPKANPIRFGHYPTTVLDAGCASGKAGLKLKELEYEVTLADLTPSGLIEEAKSLPFKHVNLWKPISPQVGNVWGGQFDYVICCDVLEHIPEQFTMLVVRNLLDVAKSGLFLSISTQPDHFGIWVGRPLHQTIQPFEWWRDNLRELGQIVDARDLMNVGTFFLKRD